MGKSVSIFLILIIFSFVLNSESVTIDSIPDPKKEVPPGSIYNQTNLISESEKIDLNDSLANLENKYKLQFAIVLLSSIGENDPREFANQLFEKWGIGEKGKDNGLLLLIVEDRRSWTFEVGYGLEGLFPDVVVNRIGRDVLVPNFRSGNVAKGLLSAIVEVESRLQLDRNSTQLTIDFDPSSDQSSTEDSETSWWFYIGVAIYGMVSFFVFFLWIGHLAGLSKDEQDVASRIQRVKNTWKSPWLWLTFLLFFPFMIFLIWVSAKVIKNLKGQKKDCPECGAFAFEKLTTQRGDSFKENGEKKEEELGRVKMIIWQCASCNHFTKEKKWIFQYDSNRCENCSYHTLRSRFLNTMKEATYDEEGLDEYHKYCVNCGYEGPRYTQKVPRKEREEVAESSSPLISGSSGSFGGSSSGSSGSSGWGGGRSGGGGASGNW
ncbi:MAG: TPM domain-containing protein [Leptospira sp.]|nr:TPM domain-containing protein [Leptospira sp.]